MNFSKYISLFFLSLFLFTCSGLKSSWTNFRAHYNTYYNAEKSFKAGLKNIEDQPVEINPELPIRVHRKSPRVSEEDFNNAIEKGAQILRKFPESKWTDDALFLIGKSYYYKGDYYLAIEKFEELTELTGNPRFKQWAAIWKGRSLLDLEQYGEGISYITNNVTAGFWSPSLKAEFQVLLAEHLAMQENWSEAADYLGDALVNLEGNVLKARAFFLYGQVLERLERYGEAFFAYDKVASRFPDYEYVYWSELKKAEAARQEGNLESALSIYTSMSKDDKNFSRRDRINYEIARTREMQGNIQQAEKGYKELLRSDNPTTSRNVQAKTYYRLGKIYSDDYNDFSTAAAYFDSSSSQVTNISYLESNSDAQKLASAYGSYATLKARINRLDSLLWLGSLPPAQRDSVLDIIRERKRKSINERLENRKNADNRLVNISSGNRVEQGNTSASVYGFLNYRNPQLKRESINKFEVVWGNRPLSDNWRRIEVVRATGISSDEAESAPVRNTAGPVSGESDSELYIDVREIPTTEEKKDEYVKELVSAKYELGNLFFLTMNMPDSAKAYFNNIVHNYPDSPLVPQSMYSLFEIYSETGNDERAGYWGNRILREFAGSRYAKKISARINREQEATTDMDSSGALLSQLQSIETSVDSLSPVQAEQFRRLAIANRSAEIAPFIHYKAIKTYVELAKSNTNPELYNQFLEARANSDTPSLTADSSDSTASTYPFYGTYWDSVRTVITEYDTMFAKSPHAKKLNTLKEVLDFPSRPGPGKPLKACTDLNTVIEIVGGMAEFLSTVDYPDDLRNMKLSGEITYEILITEKGEVGSYNLVSTKTLSAIEQAFETAIKNNLSFEPVSANAKPQEIRCEMTFSVKN